MPTGKPVGDIIRLRDWTAQPRKINNLFFPPNRLTGQNETSTTDEHRWTRIQTPSHPPGGGGPLHRLAQLGTALHRYPKPHTPPLPGGGAWAGLGSLGQPWDGLGISLRRHHAFARQAKTGSRQNEQNKRNHTGSFHPFGQNVMSKSSSELFRGRRAHWLTMRGY